MGNIFVRLLGGVLAALFVTLSAHAQTNETIPATSFSGWIVNTGKTYTGKTGLEVCTAAFDAEWNKATFRHLASWYTTGGNCYCERLSDKFTFSCIGRPTQATLYECPTGQGWTLSGTTCTRPACTADQERINGVCVPKCASDQFRDSDGQCKKDCTGKQGKTPLDTHFATVGSGSFNHMDCDLKCNKQVAITSGPQPDDSVQIVSGYIQSQCTYTGKPGTGNAINSGESFTPSPDKPKTPQDCLGNGDGYIQSSTGAVTCVPSSNAPPGQKPVNVTEQTSTKDTTSDGTGTKNTESNTTKQTNSDGSGTQTRTQITDNGDGTKTETKTVSTKNKDGSITETVTKTKIAADGTRTQESTNTKTGSDQKTFCQQNPTAAACQDKDSTFRGTCAGGFVCTGDAATCAIAKASHEMKCQGEKRDALNDLGDKVTEGTDGKRVQDIPTQTINLAAINTGGGGGAACPGLPPLFGQQIDMTTACSILGGLGNAGVALALLMAGFIVVGGIRGL